MAVAVSVLRLLLLYVFILIHFLSFVHCKIDADTSPTRYLKTFLGKGEFCYYDGSEYWEGINDGAPSGLWQDTSGNLYVAFLTTNRIMKVSEDGQNMTTIIGFPDLGGTDGDGGLAVNALLNSPMALWGDSMNHYLYIADSGNHRIRRINLITQYVDRYAGFGGFGTGGSIAGENVVANSSRITAPSQMIVYYNTTSTATIKPSIVFIDSSRRLQEIYDNSTATTPGVRLIRSMLYNQITECTALWASSTGDLYITTQTHRVFRINGANKRFSIIAGTGMSGMAGDGELATLARFSMPLGIWGHPNGTLYIADSNNFRIRKLTPFNATHYIVNTIAGTGNYALSGIGGPADNAGIGNPKSIVGDIKGNLWITVASLQIVLKISSDTKILSIVAGIQTNTGYNGDNIPGTAALLGNIGQLWIDSTGSLFIPDSSNHRIRKLNTTSGIIKTVVGTGKPGLAGSGTPVTSAQINFPMAVSSDTIGNLYYTDYNYRVRKVDIASQLVLNIAGAGEYGQPGYSGEDLPATSSQLSYPTGIYGDSNGNLYIADRSNLRIRVIDKWTRRLNTIAGNGTTGYYSKSTVVAALTAKIEPYFVFVDSLANVYFSDLVNQKIQKYTSNGYLTAIAGTGERGLSGEDTAATASMIAYPAAIWVNSVTQELYFSDAANNQLRKVNLVSKNISTVIGSAVYGSTGFFRSSSIEDKGPANKASIGISNSMVLTASNRLLIVDANYNRIRSVAYNSSSEQLGISSIAGTNSWTAPNEVPATSAYLSDPYALWIDPSENIYFTESNQQRIRRIDGRTTIITIVAGTGNAGNFRYETNIAALSARLNFPSAICGMSNASIFFSDSNSFRIRQLQLAGTFYNIFNYAGTGTIGSSNGPIQRLNGSFGYIRGMYCDTKTFKIYMTDRSTHVIRLVDTITGIMSIIVGMPNQNGFNGDGLQPRSTRLNNPVGIFVDTTGNIYFTDSSNQRIRKIDINQNITTTVIGSGVLGLSDQPTPATAALMRNPTGLVADTLGNIYFSDGDNYRIRKYQKDSGLVMTIVGFAKYGVCESTTEFTPVISSRISEIFAIVPDLFSNRIFLVDHSSSRVRVMMDVSSPSSQPTSSPTRQPSHQPSRQPSRQPFSQPSVQPSRQPSRQPTQQPIQHPSGIPSVAPTVQPTRQPVLIPTSQPSRQPSRQPTVQPSRQPSTQPTAQPLCRPTKNPSSQPSIQPSRQPSGQPTIQPTLQPFTKPSGQPTSQPSFNPSIQPTRQPSGQPSSHPTRQPTVQPSRQPSTQPTAQPLCRPTKNPSSQPSIQPSRQPSGQPTSQPSFNPSIQPTRQPSGQPTIQPTLQPFTKLSGQPTSQPSKQPTVQPSGKPSRHPTIEPSMQPSGQPSRRPLGQPSTEPSVQPSAQPSGKPSIQPSGQPSRRPLGKPSTEPSVQPSTEPSGHPSRRPLGQPSTEPSVQPSAQPSGQPSAQSSGKPSIQPSGQPSRRPLGQPSTEPSVQPFAQPSGKPSRYPTAHPSCHPSGRPVTQPSGKPSGQPSGQPLGQAFRFLTAHPSVDPSRNPSTQSSRRPAELPSAQPSRQPYVNITGQPSTSRPFIQPSGDPSVAPSTSLSCKPSELPSTLPSQRPVSYPSAHPTVQHSHQSLPPLSRCPSFVPTPSPTVIPSLLPTTNNPTKPPTATPSNQFTKDPTISPTIFPSLMESYNPTFAFPSAIISDLTSFTPTHSPSALPTSAPYPTSIAPTVAPLAISNLPTTKPSTSLPTRIPTINAILIIKEAQFLNTGNIIVSLNQDMVSIQSTEFLCTNILVLQPFSDSNCKWRNISTIEIVNKELLNVGLSVKLLYSEMLNFKCSLVALGCLDIDTKTKILVALPSNPLKPAISGLYPATISKCDDLVLDFTSSSGRVSQQWFNVSTSVELRELRELRDKSNLLQAAFRSIFTTDRPFRIHKSLLLPGIIAQFNVKLCNIFHLCEEINFNVSVSNSTTLPPTVFIAGSNQRIVTKSMDLMLSASAFVSQCDAVARTAGLSYTWEVWTLPDNRKMMSTVTGSRYRVPVNSLSSAMQYLIRLSVFDTIQKLTSDIADTLVYVSQSSLVATIQPANMQLLRVGSSLFLDASTSNDPDNSNTILLFTWSCLQQNGYPCTISVNVTRDGKQVVVRSPTGSINTTNIITCVVTAGSRNASTSMIVKVVPSIAPELRILSNPLILNKVNVEQKVVIEASIITTKRDCEAKWNAFISSSQTFIPLSSLAVSPVTTYLGASNNPNWVNLILKPGSLAEGVSYSFVLSCGSSTVAVQVTSNSPPSNGNYLISPAEGREFETMFTLSATAWFDNEDLPLSYEFSLSTTAGDRLPIRRKSEFASTTSLLPAGQVASKYTLQTFASVFDSLGAVTVVTQNVKVSTMDSVELQQQLSKSLQNVSWDSMGFDDINSLVVSTATALSRLDCTKAPNCTSLHRNTCTQIANTCGLCLEGYVGEEQSANTACKAKLTTDGSDKNCLYDCSSRGSCIYLHKYTKQNELSCKVGDTDCEAICTCMPGFGGVACEKTEFELQEDQSLRGAALVGLQTLLSQDFSIASSSILNHITTLTTLIRFESDLHNDTLFSMQDIIVDILQRGKQSKNLPIDKFADILQPLSAGMSLAAQVNGSASVVSIANFVNDFLQIVQSQRVVGEATFENIQADFRMLASKLSTSNFNTIALPTSKLESLQSKPTTTINLASNNLSSASIISIQATELAAYLLDPQPSSGHLMPEEVFQSNIIHMQASHPKKVVLHIPTFSTFSSDQENITFLCYENDVTTYYKRCPTSKMMLSHACNGTAGYVVKLCPRLLPTCISMQLQNQSIHENNACRTLIRNETHIICSCTMLTASAEDSGRRKLQQTNTEDIAEKSGLLTIAAMAIYTFNGIDDTFQTAPSFNSIEAFQDSMVVIAMFAMLWFAGGLLLLAIYRRRSQPSSNNKSHKKDLSQKRKSTTILPTRPASSIETSMEKQKHQILQQLLAYVDSIFPPVYQSNAFMIRMKKEVFRHHAYLRIAFAPMTASSVTAASSRLTQHLPVAEVLHLLTIQTMLIFLLAALYDLQSPSDSQQQQSCYQYRDKISCLQKKSMFDRHSSFCTWHEGSGDLSSGHCIYEEQPFTFQMALYCTIISSICTAVILRPLNFLFKLLKAPSEEHIRTNVVAASAFRQMQSQVVNMARRASNVTKQQVETLVAILPTMPSTTKKASHSDKDMLPFKKAFSTLFIPEQTNQAHQEAQHSIQTWLSSKGEHRVGSIVAARSSVAFRPNPKLYFASTRLNDQLIESEVKTITTLIYSQAHLMYTSLQQIRRALPITPTLAELHLLHMAEESFERYLQQWQLTTLEKASEKSNVAFTFKRSHIMQASFHQEFESIHQLAENCTTELTYATETHRGVTILQHFLLDLLGRTTITAKLFHAKFTEDFNPTMVVKRRVKYLIWIGIALINAAFIYFTILRAYQRGKHWQYALLSACIIQSLLEIGLYESLECIWIHVLVPNVINREVRRVYQVLQESLKNVLDPLPALATTAATEEKGGEENDKKKRMLDVTDYFFLSKKLALQYPELIESMIVLNYTTISPGEFEHLWNSSLRRKAAPSWNIFYWREWISWLWLYASFLVLFCLAMIPFEIQRMLIRFVQPFLYGGMIVVWISIEQSFIYQAIFIVVLVVGCGSLFLMYRRVNGQEEAGGSDLVDNRKVFPWFALDTEVLPMAEAPLVDEIPFKLNQREEHATLQVPAVPTIPAVVEEQEASKQSKSDSDADASTSSSDSSVDPFFASISASHPSNHSTHLSKQTLASTKKEDNIQPIHSTGETTIIFVDDEDFEAEQQRQSRSQSRLYSIRSHLSSYDSFGI